MILVVHQSYQTNLNIARMQISSSIRLAKLECYSSNYVFEVDSAPEECPSCHYSLTFWLEHAEQKPPSVKDFVRPSILSIDVNESAWEAAKIMRDRDATSILVLINDQPAGIVTEKDI